MDDGYQMMNEPQDNPADEIARLRKIIDDYARICEAASAEISMLRRRLEESHDGNVTD